MAIGCFSKNGIAYWSAGGSVEQISSADIPPLQKRISCGETTDNICESNVPASCGNKKFCQLETGVCSNAGGIQVGTCNDIPELCIEIFSPVCGCDGQTHPNECFARSKGVNLNYKGECTPPPQEDIACRTEEDCKGKSQEMGIISFFSGEFRTSTKGCFLKNNQAYFASGGTEQQMSDTNIPPAQERIWCTNGVTSTKNSVLQQAKANTDSQVQPESATSSAYSIKSFALGSLFLNAAKADSANHQPRTLSTCMYNAEVLLFGCSSGW